MRSKLFLAVAVGLALFACLGGCTSTEQAAKVLHSKWDGQPADSFFLQYGPPVSTYAMTDGGKIFTWVGGQANVPLPGTASTTTQVIGNTATSTTTYNPGGNIAVGCRVQIVTNQSGVITAIRPMGDTIGLWQTSRCAEFFGVSPFKPN